ncbi:MAG: hypothetical protein H7257_08470 [Taibaiella sp.]|nr:hypothetical protein [Taibaiella sp.]
MRKYIAVIALMCFCCGFNICEKKIKADGKVTRIYIYPDCNDTACYLKQRYQANHIVEYLYINSKLRYKRILDKAAPWIVNEFAYGPEAAERQKQDTIYGNIPDRGFDINDTCSLNIEYFADGGYHICTYGYNRANECRHPEAHASTIVFDTLYKTKMMGNLQIICDTNSVTDALTNEELIKIVHRERQTGRWLTYNFEDYIIDSATYKPGE